ncbi:HEAT repeat domain-containing protein [Aequorivita xiaoshiensis]|uniref:HEAT repeat domain-containing protein n=1 Tax=Aequorivita xiaoshiensis TaxID=2874476 RepID=A0A9X1U6Z0_9FLAO|nr:hypothetical protein [Aequorivita xiaoshiensis]MCG2432118.1 hypothetical protein [Aequorivita xiaoshiensis]
MKKLLFIFFLIFIHLTAKADSWKDPSWKVMIAESDAIALVEYVSNGDFRAQAKILTIYKGKVNSDIIWISGFSNRYGPIDKMKIGDKFIVFLNKNKPSKRNLEYWEEQIKEDKELIPYVNALKNNNAYYVWTPTSGDLKVKSKKVQYDLIQTTFYDNQKFYSLKEFEEFLNSFNSKKKSFHHYLLSELSDNLSNDKTSQVLMMLYLTSYKKYNSIYEDIYKTNLDNSLYALAKLLGNIKGNSSRDLLVKLLDNKNSIVQGEAVRQLSSEGSDFIGPILLSKLSKAGEDGIYPQNLMDPVQNSVDGGKIEIIKTLGELEYKPAIPKLLPLLNTDNEYLFMTTFNVLNKLGTKDYIPYLNSHLEKGTNDLIYEICDLITENDLTECIPSLMSYISNHDKTIHPSKEFTISWCCGLSNFDNQEVREFLISDFKKVMEMKRGENIDNKKDWLQEYISSFNQLKMIEVKSLIYDAMFEYYGFNSKFRKNNLLFDKKQNVENEFRKQISLLEKEPDIERIEFLLQIDSKTDAIIDYSLNVIINSNKNEWKEIEPTFNSVRDKLIEQGYNKDNIRLTTGYIVQNLGGSEPLEFKDGLMTEFLKYISTNPDKDDMIFLQKLSEFEYAKTDFEKRKLNKAIESCKSNLN